jgi:RimJ/RimL family protein N-acetyltransferase
MLYELAPAYYYLVAPLVAEMWSDKALVDSVIEGSRPGRVFVDNVERPTAAFICAEGGDYYLVGDASPSPLRQFIQDHPTEAEVFEQIFAYFTPERAWKEALVEDSGGAIPFYEVRGFRYARETIEPPEYWRAKARPNATVRQIDEALLQDVEEGRIRTNNEFPEETLKMIAWERFGFCAIADAEVASVAWAFAISSRFSSLFIDTEERFRRQGLATLACAAFIDYSLAQGLMPLWACLTSNVASAATALTLGFEEVSGRYESAWVPYGRDFRGPAGLWIKDEAELALPPGTVVWRRVGEG